MASIAEAPIHIHQTAASEVIEMVVQPYYSERYHRILARGDEFGSPQPQFVAAAVVEDFGAYDADEDVAALARDLTKSHDILEKGTSVPVLTINRAYLDVSISSPDAGLYAKGNDMGSHGGLTLEVPLKTGLRYSLGFDGGFGALTHGPSVTEDGSVSLLMPKTVLVTDNEEVATEAAHEIGRSNSGVMAVGEVGVGQFLRAIADKEYGDPSARRSRRHETSISLLGIAALKRQGADIALGAGDFIHEVGMDIVARLIVSGLDRQRPGYYANTINDIGEKLPAIEFTPDDEPLITVRSLRLMEESQVYRALANLAHSNDGSVDEFVKDQVGSLMKNLLGVELSR